MKTLNLRSLYTKISNIPVATLIVFVLMSLVTIPTINAQTVTTTSASTIPLCEITRGLTTGSSGEDVRCLQRYLNWAGFTVAASGSGSPGNESSYFGQLTANAVARWQNANAAQVLVPAGLTTGTGYFGSLSFNAYVNIVRTQLGLTIQ